TLESNELHRQWVIIDLGKYRKINAIGIKWGNPYALSYALDYARGNDPSYFDPYEPGIWYPFTKNFVENSKGENKIIKIADKPVRVRFIRISMTQSSYTATDGAKDIRDSLGFSIKEIRAGLIEENGKFHDWMHHSPDHDQTVIRVSSTDPWHTAKDMDPNIEQAGIDLIFKSGITAGQPALFPAGLLYDTPENVLAMLKYLRSKHYPVYELEMGEEPEGQLINPVDYAALYYQLGKKIRQLEPTMRMGGPGFASLSFTPDDSTTFTESKWTSEFLNYLKIHNGIDLFNFFTFEWYPFDDIHAPSAPQLAAAPRMLAIALKNIQNNILPANTPLYVTEYGYSAYEGKSEVEIEGALMYADILGKFMELGGSKSFLYGYEPAWLQQTNNYGYGNNMIFGLGDNGKIKYKTAAFYAMQMLTHFWAHPSDSLLEMYPSESDISNRKKQSLVSSYPIRRPDGEWSLMLINKDPRREWNVDIDLENMVSKEKIAWYPLHLTQYSKTQYHWKSDGMNGYPDLSLPPVTMKIDGLSNIALPPYSITIVY
ncbi:MAG: discoidin domain-containing protein, partial [Ginsengibacter sp.]